MQCILLEFPKPVCKELCSMHLHGPLFVGLKDMFGRDEKSGDGKWGEKWIFHCFIVEYNFFKIIMGSNLDIMPKLVEFEKGICTMADQIFLKNCVCYYAKALLKSIYAKWNCDRFAKV